MGARFDVSSLDLRGALDFAIMIEEDAQLRYAELARRLGADGGGAGAIFREMIGCEGEHRRRLAERRDALFVGERPRIEVSVLEEGPERAELDGDELPGTAREALLVCLAAERRAHDFFRDALPRVADAEVRAFFEELRLEEVDHQALLAARLAELPAAPAPADGAPAAPAAGAALAADDDAEPVPDRAELLRVVPLFDAATQAVARGVLDRGLAPAEVADELGVSRRTARVKLRRFLQLARGLVAVAVATATLGCAGGQRLPAPSPGAPPPGARPAPGERAAPGDREAPAWADRDLDVRRQGVQRGADARGAGPRVATRPDIPALQAQVAARMPRHDPVLHGRIARAIHAEALRAGLDPLLVLALIHVESSFDPSVVSGAGAVGLMQLREPTMRRELQRSGLAAASPRDPVANVRAGVRYLRRLVDAFGDVDVALMAYNAGPGRIRAHARAGGIPERFHAYPRRVRGELERVRSAVGVRGAPALARAPAPGARPLG